MDAKKEQCCSCKFWRLTRAMIANGKREHLIGVCRWGAPIQGWPEMEEHDFCGSYEPIPGGEIIDLHLTDPDGTGMPVAA